MTKFHCLMAASLLAAAATANANDAETSATYLDRSSWSWKASSVYAGYDDDIMGLDAVHDGDASTCWHTNYSASPTSPERYHPHWLMVDRGADKSEFYGIAYTPRQKLINQSCTSFMIYLSDTDLGNTPATTEDDIRTALGEPDYVGSWEPSLSEQFFTFSAPSTARYILFVHLASYNSSSSACAEFNLTGSGSPAEPIGYNAVKITPADGSEPHRIAIDGNRLTITMNGTAVRLANSDITIEYMPSELARMEPEKYDFDNGLYTGPKKDAIDFPAKQFALAVEPAAGKVKTLTEAAITPEAESARINTACAEPLRVESAGETVRELSVHKMALNLVDGKYMIDKIPALTDGIYTLSIPAEFFVDADGNRSAAMTLDWDVDSNYEFVGISETDADCPTLTFSRRGDRLIIGGVGSATAVSLTDAAGRTVASAPVGARATATLSVGALPKGVYFLSAGSKTLKIIL